MRVVLLAAALALIFPSVLAQDLGAPHLSPEQMTLYAHHRDGDDESVGWMNTNAADPDSTDIAMGASANYVTERDWTLRLVPGVAGEVVLDGDLQVNAHVGGGSAQGVMDVSTELLVDGTAVATGDAQQVILEPASAAYPLVTWTIPVSLTIPPGASMEWKVHAGNGIATAIFLGVHEDRGKSHIVLPVVSADVPAGQPEAEYTQLDAAPELDLSLDGTPRILVYNWTEQGNLSTVEWQANGTGNVSARLIVDNQTAWQAALAGNASAPLPANATAGNWSLVLETGTFNGTLRLQLLAQPGGTGTPTQTATGGPGNETTGGRGSPAPMAIFLAVLAVGALAARRR